MTQRFEWVRDIPDLPFHLGRSEMVAANGIRVCGWGRDPDPAVARVKARAEAVERLAFVSPSRLRAGRMRDLHGAIDPRSIVRYAARQYRRPGFPFAPFHASREYLWVPGRDAIRGDRVEVLADCVFAARALQPLYRRPLYTHATSSGCATARSRREALGRAALELIERDAFARCWAAQRGGMELSRSSLMSEVEARAQRLRRRGCLVTVQRLPSPFAFVGLVGIQSQRERFTCVGSAASLVPEDAVLSALGEAEALAWACLAGFGRRTLRPSAVRTAGDHADLYTNPAYYRRADRLLRPRLPETLRATAKRFPGSTDKLVSELGRHLGPVVMVDLATPGAARASDGPLQSVRVVVPGLIPITFGWGCLPLGMMGMVARGARFPHPFG